LDIAGEMLSLAAIDTLAALHLHAMRHHRRPAALLVREGDGFAPVPDWRFERHVLRIALFLKERMGVHPGDRVAIASPLRAEWFAADVAAVLLGAVSFAASDDAVAALAPRVAFAARPIEGVETICFEDGPRTWQSALDLGGTLDTAERAQALRAAARELKARFPALAVAGGAPLTQGQALARVAAAAPAEGPAYIAGDPRDLDTRLRLHAAFASGVASAALGTPGHEAEERALLQPPSPPARRGFMERLLSGFTARQEVHDARRGDQGIGPAGLARVPGGEHASAGESLAAAVVGAGTAAEEP
jgi:hypothetical protein